MGGYNSSIFAYGQTGAGKTYTMQGPLAAALQEDNQQVLTAPQHRWAPAYASNSSSSVQQTWQVYVSHLHWMHLRHAAMQEFVDSHRRGYQQVLMCLTHRIVFVHAEGFGTQGLPVPVLRDRQGPG